MESDDNQSGEFAIPESQPENKPESPINHDQNDATIEVINDDTEHFDAEGAPADAEDDSDDQEFEDSDTLFSTMWESF